MNLRNELVGAAATTMSEDLHILGFVLAKYNIKKVLFEMFMFFQEAHHGAAGVVL